MLAEVFFRNWGFLVGLGKYVYGMMIYVKGAIN